MKPYDPKKIEPKWQKYWEKKGLYEFSATSKKPKFYSLIEFPFPSGDGLHVGHIRSNTAMDIVSRKRRMEGFNVLYPIGWDAFGLPTENYALKTGIHPAVATKNNTDTFRRQLKALGFSFDWTREINTTDPAYYKWTQWIFLQFFKKGLAYKKKMEINWCPKDKVGLANEEVVDGKCERCGTAVEKREKEQWMLAITKYADRLDKDLDTVNFLEKIKIQQRNWIGKSEGAELEFKIKDSEEQIKVFTTRPDTLFGVTYVVLAPEHPLVQTLELDIENWAEVLTYVQKTKKETDIERAAENKPKTGVELKGVTAINPANGEEVPVWIADYVLAQYGTGAVMAVPAHDQRDFEFAKKYGLPVRQVVAEHLIDTEAPPRPDKQTVERRVVQAVIKHWKEDKILVIKWKKQPWTTFVIGGAEKGETGEQAIAREVREETGFRNFRVVRRLGWKMFSEFFAAHKDENRFAEMEVFYVELQNPDQDELSSEEKEKHELAWLPTNKIISEVNPCNEKHIAWDYLKSGEHAYEGLGDLINSAAFDRMPSDKAKKEITDFVGGKWITTYKLRDWVFSRQRYWGEPIPLVYCSACAKASAGKENAGWIAVAEKNLPVKLPDVEKYQPTETGESPLAAMSEWVNTPCPQCGGEARRETDTMPQWAGSSWYFLRYIDPKNKKEPADKKMLKKHMPVDWYNGGMEHTTLHLLYSRFWNKFLFDIGVAPTSEPYAKRTSHGLILAEKGEKMSKSKGNVINPDDIVKRYGADTLRVYEMFMGPFDQAISWSEESIIGPRRFIEKIWKLSEKVSKTGAENTIESALHPTVKKVSEDIETMRFNTAISSMMILANEMEKESSILKSHFELFLRILAPFTPHLADELWAQLGHKKSIHLEKWPAYNPAKIVVGMLTIAIQVNGKVRAEMTVSPDDTEEQILQSAEGNEAVKKWTEGRPIKKKIYVKGRLVSFVV